MNRKFAVKKYLFILLVSFVVALLYWLDMGVYFILSNISWLDGAEYSLAGLAAIASIFVVLVLASRSGK